MMKFLTNGIIMLLLALTFSVQAQEKTVSGTVSDESGMPLAGATVIVKDTSTGAATDFDGKYSISASQGDILLVSYIGYVNKEVAVTADSALNITLAEDVSALDEVVVVGFGTQKKSNVTGSNTFVKMDEIIADRPIVNAAESLQGVAAGLQVTNNTGQPGSNGVGINIRGFTSINGGSPLILINNVQGSLEDINPRDIESISVLKDAAASSIYGSRAAFGVIVITTKKAKRNEKVKFAYDVTTSISTTNDLPEKATTREFVEALSEWGVRDYFAGQNVQDWLGFLDQYDSDPSGLDFIKDPVSGATYPIHFDSVNSQHYPVADSNLIEEFLGDSGLQTIHNFTISGGGEKVAYRLSNAYSYEDGIMVTDRDNFKKYNLNALFTADLTSSLESTTNIMYRSSSQSRPRASYSNAIQARMFDPTGWLQLGEETLPFDSPSNLVKYRDPVKAHNDNLRLYQQLKWSPIKNLNIIGEYTYEKDDSRTKTLNNGQRFVRTHLYTANGTPDDVFRNSSYARSVANRTYKASNIYANYSLTLGENHNLKLLAGMNRESTDYNLFSASRNGLIDITTPTFELAEGENWDISEAFYDWAVVGYFSRLNYNYKEKYFIEANFRRDGSSIFASGDQFVNLPSASIGWNISKESFMENVDFITMLKPFASWGKIGNQIARKTTGARDYYPFSPGYESYFAQWINLDTDLRALTFSPAQLISAGLTWEEIESKNIGIDINMFNNRLKTTFEVYSRETQGMLRQGAELPAILGTSAPFQNVADLETTGWDIQIGWNDRIGEDFKYNINVNVFDNVAEITKFDNEGQLLGDFREGQRLGDIWGYVSDGYYTADDFVAGTLDADLSGPNRELKQGVATFVGRVPYPGDMKFKDLNGDGIINAGNNSLITELDANGDPVKNSEGIITTGPGDRQVIGNNRKRYQFGINGSASYKNFDFSFVLSGVGKQDSFRNSDLIWPYPGVFDNIYKHQLDYWTPDNQDAYYPRVYGDPNGNIGSNYGRSRRVQTKYLSDESYLRIQNITLGYTLDGKVLEKMNLDRVRVFISGNNIHTFDNLPKGLEPDQGSNGVYPIMTRYTFGVNVSF